MQANQMQYVAKHVVIKATTIAEMLEAIEDMYLDYLHNHESIADFAKAYNADIEDAIFIINSGMELMKSHR